MQKYEIKDIDILLNTIEGFALDIDAILNKEGHLSEADSIILRKIYDDREVIINSLKKIISSSEGIIYINCHRGVWNSKIQPIIEKDKKQLIKLNNNVKQIDKDLRNLIKQKSLLLYSQRKV